MSTVDYQGLQGDNYCKPENMPFYWAFCMKLVYIFIHYQTLCNNAFTTMMSTTMPNAWE